MSITLNREDIVRLCERVEGAQTRTYAIPKLTNEYPDMTIEDGYAITEVDQTFSNPNQQDLEAIYSFPTPEKGVVSEFTVWIDGKPVIGEVLEKQKAQQLYEEEKAAGRDAGMWRVPIIQCSESITYFGALDAHGHNPQSIKCCKGLLRV